MTFESELRQREDDINKSDGEGLHTRGASGLPANTAGQRQAAPSLCAAVWAEMTFRIAGTMAFHEAAKKAEPELLEPVMSVEVLAPTEHMGDVMGNLSGR